MKKVLLALTLIFCLLISACSNAGAVSEPVKPDDSPSAVIEAEDNYVDPDESDAASEQESEADVTSGAAVETEEERIARLAKEEAEKKTEEAVKASEDAERAARERASEGSGGIVYLTFDDGPCGYTDDVLEILAKYDIKATFFLTGQHPGCYKYIKDIYDAGHSIGVHSFSHEYYNCYASEEAYYEETEKVSDLILEQTGMRPVLMRFPGGSSNAVSAKYSTGIMTALVKGVEERGYTYFDWNVGSGDTSNGASVDSITANVIAGIKKHRESVVLMHDFKKNTVIALPSVIEWGLANGYEFIGLTPESPTCHFQVKN